MYRELFDFIEKAPTAFQAVGEFRTRLLKDGAVELREDAPWELRYGVTYFITRNDSALVVFSIPEEGEEFRVFAAHSDSPSFKVKENPEIVVENKYVKLNVEPYGGMICSSWLDRPLSVAGRLIVRDGDSFKTVLVNVDRDLLVIPNVAIHQNREVNKGYAWNMQTDMLPLLGGIEAKGSFMKIVAEHAGVREEDVIGHDLFLYIREKGRVFGANGEYMASSRFDDIECALAGFLGFKTASKKRHIPVLMIFDNEEVGSQSRQGAGSTFLLDTVTRIAEELPRGVKALRDMVPGSFLLSADNGHALHPNHPEKCDPTNRPVLNGGILIKYASTQRYATDGLSGAFVKKLCEDAGVPYQIFHNRSDMAGGGTLGSISTSQVAFPLADIGLTELAMHSSVETAGVRDFEYLVKLAERFFE